VPSTDNAGVAYLMAGQSTELDRLQRQSRVWEPAGKRQLDVLGEGEGKRAIDLLYGGGDAISAG